MAKCDETAESSVVARGLAGGTGEGRREGGKSSTGDFQGSERIPHGTEMVDTCHYTLVNMHRAYSTKNRLSVNRSV